MDHDPYADLAQPFVDHYGSLRGALRFELVSRQLDRHLHPQEQRIVDVGGGAGHQAVRLARAGHHVTLVDPSEEMLARARATLDTEVASVQQRVALVAASAEQASRRLAGERFEVVCCHAVLPYVDDPSGLIDALGALSRPGALLSLVFKNADALAMRPALEGRWSDAERAFEATEDVGGLGVTTKAHHRAEVAALLDDAGFTLEAWYGIRIFSDHLGDVPATPLETVLPVELEASGRDPYRAVGRLLHLVARRR